MHNVDALAGGSVGSSRRKRVDLDLVAAEEDGRRAIRRRGRVALIYHLHASSQHTQMCWESGHWFTRPPRLPSVLSALLHTVTVVAGTTLSV
jgi:hypothetical protein